MNILSFDVGGSKIASAVFDGDGKICGEVNVMPTPHTAAEIEAALKDIASGGKYDGCALATAGIVCGGKLAGKPNNLPQGYENIDFAAAFKTPFIIENDANAALWAEYKKGCLRGAKDAVMLTLGTDVGCGIICGGRILHGKSGAAGEVRFDCSGTSLRRLAKEAGSDETDCFAVQKAALRRAGAERTAFRTWQENLAEAVFNINCLLDTEAVAFSGSLAEIVDYAVINTMVKLLCPHNPPLVKHASCGKNAGLAGAALLCAQKLKG